MTVMLATTTNDQFIRHEGNCGDSIPEKMKFDSIRDALQFLSESIYSIIFDWDLNIPDATIESINQFIADHEIDLKFTIEEIN